ncbi:MAG: competence protein ComEA helix-hairpin-helix repeat protein [Thermomicrobiales bacterium]|nr:competence protein ComEA helix-hairpin-helix repeat protein [Thermomicrobiales bacterium]
MSLTRIGLTVVALVAAVAAVYAIFQALDERSAPPIVIEDASANLPVVVEVRGEVESPGVFALSPGARLQDAIAAAGGLSEGADLSTVNLARRLRDGELVVILALPVPGSTPVARAGGVDAAPDAADPRPRININTASAEELEALPGIGEVIASRIIEYREERGPFRSVDDLIHVQGISSRAIEEFRDQVTTSP